MAVNKNAQLRYNVIDKCLSNLQRSHTYYSILEKVNHVLIENGYDGIQLRQLQEDIKFMESDAGFSIELQEDLKEGRRRILRYNDKNFSISSHPLNQLDVEQLNATLTILSRYKYRTEFSWLNELIPRMEQAFDLVDQDQTGIISYQNNPDLEGLEWLGVLFNLIVEKKTALISYEPFNQEAKDIIVHPYHLKQFNNRWFLICKTEGYTSLSNYPLDRIKLVEEVEANYILTSINWLDYFSDMIGVSKMEGINSVKIQLKFSLNRINYVKTKPLHGTQKLLKSDPSGLSIQIDVVPNPELYQALLSFGPDVEVMSPDFIREKMTEKTKLMLQNYKHAE